MAKNDLEKFKETLKEIGCKFEEKTALVECGEKVYKTEYDGYVIWDTKIELDNGVGYYSFVCEFYFLEGKFQNHGVWE